MTSRFSFQARGSMGTKAAGDVDNLFCLFVLDNQAIDFVEQWLHKVCREIPGDNLLALLAHGGQLLDHRSAVLFADGVFVQSLAQAADTE